MKDNNIAVESIKQLANRGIHPGTETTRAILDRLASPDEKLKIIHIAGTNGKGSTAEFFTAILVSAGKKTGTFTSPAVYDYYDQFRIDGVPLSAEKLEAYFGEALEASKGLGATEFEVETAGIIHAFACEGCEYAVIECGMGGLNDATNAVRRKSLAVITSISLEHTSFLGKTIEKICEQKAGIIKDCPAIINSHQHEEAKLYFKKRGLNLASSSLNAFELSTEGCLQPFNAQTAIEGARLLGIEESAIFEGIKNAKPCGRLERFKADGREFILDGAHNPGAFEPLRQFLKDYKNLTIIYGNLSDKDADGNLKALSGLTDNIIAVKCESPRATELAETEGICRKYFKNVSTAESLSSALDKVTTQTAVVCGSFTLLREAKKWIEKRQK